MATASIEEYLETIYRLNEKGKELTTTNISRMLKVAPSSVTEMLQRMEKEGYIKYEPYRGTALTRKGREIGKKVVKRHRIIEKFLDIIGLQKDMIHEEACKLEHAISDEVEKAIDKNIGYPEESPTGKQIPRDKKDSENRKRKQLIHLQSGDRATVIEIKGSKGVVQRLMDMGLTPGAEIKVIESPSFCPLRISVRGAKLAIDRGIATKILVEAKQ